MELATVGTLNLVPGLTNAGLVKSVANVPGSNAYNVAPPVEVLERPIAQTKPPLTAPAELMKALVAGTVPWTGKVTLLLAAGLVPSVTLSLEKAKTNFLIGLPKRGPQYIAPSKNAPGPNTYWGMMVAVGLDAVGVGITW